MDAAHATRNLRRPVSLRTADYDYILPEGLIARHPAERRDGSRMMVLHRAQQRIEHRAFADFPSFLQSGDLVVLNDTRVIPARAFSDDGRIELLFLERCESDAHRNADNPVRIATPRPGLSALQPAAAPPSRASESGDTDAGPQTARLSIAPPASAPAQTSVLISQLAA